MGNNDRMVDIIEDIGKGLVEEQLVQKPVAKEENKDGSSKQENA